MGQRRNDKGKFNNALRLKKMKNNISNLREIAKKVVTEKYIAVDSFITKRSKISNQ
jgi:hypothetical protein